MSVDPADERSDNWQTLRDWAAEEPGEAASAIQELRDAIRQHRDERGDDRCHADDARLYAVLPEGDIRPAIETAVTLANCQRYIECRQTGREYISPQRRIEELEAILSRLTAAASTCGYDCEQIQVKEAIEAARAALA